MPKAKAGVIEHLTLPRVQVWLRGSHKIKSFPAGRSCGVHHVRRCARKRGIRQPESRDLGAGIWGPEHGDQLRCGGQVHGAAVSAAGGDNVGCRDTIKRAGSFAVLPPPQNFLPAGFPKAILGSRSLCRQFQRRLLLFPCREPPVEPLQSPQGVVASISGFVEKVAFARIDD